MGKPTSIISIDVQDDQFQAFLSSFAKYQEELAKLPAEWRGVGSAIGGVTNETGNATDAAASMAQQFAAGLESITALRVSVDALAVQTEKAGKGMDGFGKRTKDSVTSLKRARSYTKKIASDLRGATTTLLGWGAALGVLTGIGSGLGVLSLARGATQVATSASGINSTPGAVTSAGIHYTGLLDDGKSTLTKISQAMQDPNKGSAFATLGVDLVDRLTGEMRKPIDVMSDVIPALRHQMRQQPASLRGNYLQALGLDSLISLPEANRLANASDNDINRAVSGSLRDVNRLDMSQDMQRNFQEFNIQLGLAGEIMKNEFSGALGKLTPELTGIAEGLTDVIVSLGESDAVKQLLDDVKGGLQTFSDYIGTPQFKTDVQNFISGLNSLAKGIGKVASWIWDWFGDDNKTADDVPLISGDPGNRTYSDGRRPFWEKTPEQIEADKQYQKDYEHATNQARKVLEGRGINGQIPTSFGPLQNYNDEQNEPVQHAQSAKRRRINPFVGTGFTTMASDNGPGGAGAMTGYVPLRYSAGGQHQYDQMIDAAAKKYGVDANWYKAIVQAESAWNPNARSGAGALGLAQVMPSNALPGENLLDPRDNLNAGARVLRWSMDQSAKNTNGSLDETFRYYNGGSRRGSHENQQYPGRVRDAYQQLYQQQQLTSVREQAQSWQARREITQQGRSMGSPEVVRLLTEIRDALRDGRSLTFSASPAPGENALMDSKLIGGYS